MMKTVANRRGERLSARLTLLPEMLSERPRSQKELMEIFRVDRKTIISMIDAFSSPDQPNAIIEERTGRHLYYRLSEEYIAPRLTLSESAALLLAQEAIGATEWSPFARRARSLLKKVRRVLPSALRSRLDAMSRVYGAATTPVKDFARHEQIIDELASAAIECRIVRMHYHTLGTDTIRERDLEPYAVYFDPDGATLKVIGWDSEKNGFRPFSIDRIRQLRTTQQHFSRKPFDLHEHLATYCFNGIHDEPITVRLRAYGVTARIFAERKFHRTQRRLTSTPKTETSPETITIEMRVARGRGLERFILSWLPDIEVLAPESLRRKIAEALQHGTERNVVK